MTRHPPRPTLFPSPPLYRSREFHRLRPPQPPPHRGDGDGARPAGPVHAPSGADEPRDPRHLLCADRKSTRLNSSHANISYAVFCLKKKKKNITFTVCILTLT